MTALSKSFISFLNKQSGNHKQRDYIMLGFGAGGITPGTECLLLVHPVHES